MEDISSDFICLPLDLMKPLETVLSYNCEILLRRRCSNSKSSQDHLIVMTVKILFKILKIFVIELKTQGKSDGKLNEGIPTDEEGFWASCGSSKVDGCSKLTNNGEFPDLNCRVALELFNKSIYPDH